MRDREKILRCLAQRQGINISRLCRETGLSWARLDRLLSKLIEDGVVREARLELSGGRVVRMFFLKEAKP